MGSTKNSAGSRSRVIYTDGIHLIASESLDELHAFAQKIGLPDRWLHPTPRHPHYDLLTSASLETALQYGAVLRTSRELVSILRTCAYLKNRPTSNKPLP